MANTVEYTDWLNDVMPRVPGADESLVKQEIFAALRELCEDGYAWTETIGPLSTTANDRTLYIDPWEQDLRVAYIHRIMFGPASSSGYMKELVPLTGIPTSWYQEADNPVSYLCIEPGIVELNPIPTIDQYQKYLIDASFVPTQVETLFPDYFRTHWRDAVSDGVYSRMMAMPSKPFTNPAMATYYGRKFRNHIKRCRATTLQRFGKGTQNWNFPYFARGGGMHG